MKEENKIFLKLYKDSQRRNYLKENINVFHSFLNNPEHPPTKVNKNEWNKIYTERFKTFQNKQKEKIRQSLQKSPLMHHFGGLSRQTPSFLLHFFDFI